MASRVKVQQFLDMLNGTVSDAWQEAYSDKVESTHREHIEFEKLQETLTKASRAVKGYIVSRVGHNVDFSGDPFYINFDSAAAKNGKLCISANWIIRKFIYSTGSRHRVEVVCRIHPKSLDHIDRAISDFEAACTAIAQNA